MWELGREPEINNLQKHPINQVLYIAQLRKAQLNKLSHALSKNGLLI
jgi:hypothetical protein